MTGDVMTRMWCAAWGGDSFWALARRGDRDVGRSSRGQAQDRTDDGRGASSPSASLSETIDGVPTDALVARIRGGDREALGVVYAAYYESLCRLGALLTGSFATAEELVQDVFVSVWIRRDTLDIASDLRVYLHGAVRHLASKARRHTRVVDTTAQAIAAQRVDVPVGSAIVLPDDAAEAAQFAAAYRHILRALSERDRVALRLRWEDGFTFEQIARVLGLSTVGARGVVLRAQRIVQDALAHFRG